jgi:hypothetical protein
MHLFENLDFDRDGYITLKDLMALARSRNLPLTEPDCRALMTKLDLKRAGSVDLGEFIRSLSKPEQCLLDQIQRTVVGVKRGGGTVYRNNTSETASQVSTRSTSTATSTLSITGAIQGKMQSLRASSGRLNNFYDGLTVPHRNLPWDEDTSHTVQPLPWIGNNPQVMSDRGRHTTTKKGFEIGAFRDLAVPQFEDKERRRQLEEYKRTTYRDNREYSSKMASAREKAANELDLRRTAYSSASIMDYHNRVGRPFCHVADTLY